MQETERLLERRLPVPAYDHILKLSHIFNLLDARGAVGFTERQDNFGRMRNLARQVSSLYQERRAELGHPLGTVAALPVRTCMHARMMHMHAYTHQTSCRIVNAARSPCCRCTRTCWIAIST